MLSQRENYSIGAAVDPTMSTAPRALRAPRTPQEVAEWLSATCSEGEALDIIKMAADTFGWTPRLNLTGLLLLKPDAPIGEEASA